MIDARDLPSAPLIEAFTAADLPFLLRVGSHTPLLAPELSGGQRRVLSASAEHLTMLARSQQRPVEWVDPAVPRVLRTGMVALLPCCGPGSAFRGGLARTGCHRSSRCGPAERTCC